ncbi:MAG: PQQ-like beta-propeller repeat protein [Acidobacteria bacterium]|nr:PQQ-like beta-propeller repeat protein [Acidobacteriota bacterium]
MRRLLATAAVTIVAGIVVVAILFLFFGFRIRLDGGGTPRPTFEIDPEAHAAEVARHREAQRRQQAEATPAEAAPPEAAPTKAAPAVAAPYWTDFRGPFRDGHYRQRAIRTKWPAGGLTPLWKQPIGGGYASFVIARGRAFTIEQRGPQEVVAAYEVTTGRELWTTSWNALFRESLGGDGPRATPTWSDGVVYALGATGELRALDEATGRMLWRTNILEENGATNLDWGMAASPLIVDQTVVVLPGGPDGRSVVAYDRRTGARVWSSLSDKQAYASPMLVTLGGVRQLVVFAATRLVGLSPDRGDLLWEFPWRTAFDINAGQPLVLGENRVFLSSGYGTGAAVIELIAAGAAGPDGPAPRAVPFSVREIWRNNRMKNQFTSSVLHEGLIYGLDESILACVDAATGELRWKGGRYGYGQVLLASGHLVVLTEDGDLALVRATPERHEEIVRFPAISGKTWNHPAMADGVLLIRNLAEMAAYDLR